MNTRDLLDKMVELAQSNNLSKPFIVGGTPRDRVMEGDREISDLDITTGDEDSIKLSELLVSEIPEAKHKTYDDGHSSIRYRGLRLDFSNHFVAPNIDEELSKAGVKDITPLKKEIYSRDFTINTLLEELDFSSIYDLTGDAVDDIKARLLKCPINPDITIGIDPRRILRAIKFAVKYDFKMEDGLKTALKQHKAKLKTLPEKFVQDKIMEILRLDEDKGLDLLVEYKVLSSVSLSQPIYDTLIRRRQLHQILSEQQNA